jgi:hypothetical protein
MAAIGGGCIRPFDSAGLFPHGFTPPEIVK